MLLRQTDFNILKEQLMNRFPGGLSSGEPFSQLVYFGLDRPLANLISSSNKEVAVKEVIAWAESHNKLDALLAEAIRQVPGHEGMYQTFLQIAHEYDLTIT